MAPASIRRCFFIKFEIMNNTVIYLLVATSLISCGGASPEKIANDFCECRKIEEHQSSTKGEQCFQEWEKKYGKIELKGQDRTKFDEIINECNPK